VHAWLAQTCLALRSWLCWLPLASLAAAVSHCASVHGGGGGTHFSGGVTPRRGAPTAKWRSARAKQGHQHCPQQQRQYSGCGVCKQAIPLALLFSSNNRCGSACQPLLLSLAVAAQQICVTCHGFTRGDRTITPCISSDASATCPFARCHAACRGRVCHIHLHC
jgi:hypothetical protein